MSATYYVNVNSPKSVIQLNPYVRTLGRFAHVMPYLRKNGQIDQSATDLVRDCFWIYYLDWIDFVKNPPPERRLNAALLKWALSSELFQRSRLETIGRMLISSKSAELLAEHLLNDPDIQEMMTEQDKLEQTTKDASSKQSPQEQNVLEQKIAEMLDALLAKFGDFSSTPDAQGLRAQAVEEVQQQTRETMQALRAFGVEDGQVIQTDMKPIEEALQVLPMEFLGKLASAIGRVRGVAAEFDKPDSKQQLVTTNAGFTRNPMDVFPTSRFLLIDDQVAPELHFKTIAEFGEHGLLGLIRASQPREAGELIFLLDTSGSMFGQRNIHAKALWLGIGQAARENRQKWHAASFSSQDQLTEWITSEDDPLKTIELAKFSWDGGTDFDYALQKTFRYIRDLPNPHNADIIMITDGDCVIQIAATKVQLREMNREFGTRLITLLVDATPYGDIAKLSDYCATILTHEDIEIAARGLADALWSSQRREADEK